MDPATTRNIILDNLFRGIGQLRDEGQFCDVCVVVNNEAFSCHRLILASVSKFFKARLTSLACDGVSASVQIDHEDVSPKTFSLLLDLLYTGNHQVLQKIDEDVLKMSTYLGIDFLTKYFEEILLKVLQPQNCIRLWQVASKYNLRNLAKKACKMAAENIDKVEQKELVSLPSLMLRILLSLQQKLSMDNICKIILSWVDADVDARTVHLADFLGFISFPLLSSPYLSDLVVYRNNQMLFDYVNEGLTFHLKGINGKDENIQRKILAQQSVLKLNSQLVKPQVVVIGGRLQDGRQNPDVYRYDNGKKYPLAEIPEVNGFQFASCTWRNEMYVSGGTLRPTFFAVYKPHDNQWQVLPDLPSKGREDHAMVALNGCIYVIGGIEKDESGNGSSSLVLKYDLKASLWSEVCRLSMDVHQTTAAVSGHRIFVFGGLDAEGKKTDLVQCVDTLSCCAYIAGRLPHPTCGSRALSNGGIIYVLMTTGEVLQMWEDYRMEGKTEDHLTGEKGLTLAFEAIGKFSARDSFGAFMFEQNIVVCGGKSKNSDDLLDTSEEFSIETGKSEKCDKILVYGTASFGLYLINVPDMYLKDDKCVMPHGLRVGDEVSFKSREIGKFNRKNCLDVPGVGVITELKGLADVTVNFPTVARWRGQADQLQKVFRRLDELQ